MQGGENCLEGLSFVITGVLESIEREQASDLVKKHGGKVVTSVSKRTSYIVVGRDPGESKMSKVCISCFCFVYVQKSRSCLQKSCKLDPRKIFHSFWFLTLGSKCTISQKHCDMFVSLLRRSCTIYCSVLDTVMSVPEDDGVIL